MMLSIITAMDRNRNIGLNDTMPWGMTMKDDLKRFFQLTQGKNIIMGRKTFESIGEVFPIRQNIVLSKDREYSTNHPRALTMHSIEEVLEHLVFEKSREHFVIGGASIYEQFMPYVDRIYMTKILTYLEGDTKFPDIIGDWHITHEEKMHHEKDKYMSQYITYNRVRI
jgi:dihydrofolate reductase